MTSETWLSDRHLWGTLASSVPAQGKSLYAVLRWALPWLQSRFGQHYCTSHVFFSAFIPAPGSKHRPSLSLAPETWWRGAAAQPQHTPKSGKLPSTPPNACCCFLTKRTLLALPSIHGQFCAGPVAQPQRWRAMLDVGSRAAPPRQCVHQPPRWHAQPRCSWPSMFAS